MRGLVDSKLSTNLPDKMTLVETEVVSVEVKTSLLVGFNGLNRNYSVTQPIFVETEEGLTYINAGEIQLGDVLVGVSEDGSLERTTVVSVELDETESEVYDIRTGPRPWFITDLFMVIA
jgi:hypothetical protein